MATCRAVNSSTERDDSPAAANDRCFQGQPHRLFGLQSVVKHGRFCPPWPTGRIVSIEPLAAPLTIQGTYVCSPTSPMLRPKEVAIATSGLLALVEFFPAFFQIHSAMIPRALKCGNGDGDVEDRQPIFSCDKWAAMKHTRLPLPSSACLSESAAGVHWSGSPKDKPVVNAAGRGCRSFL